MSEQTVQTTSEKRLYYDDGWETAEKIGPVEAIENAIEDYEFLLESGPPGFGDDWDDNRRGMIRGLREAARRLRKRRDEDVEYGMQLAARWFRNLPDDEDLERAARELERRRQVRAAIRRLNARTSATEDDPTDE